MSKLYRCDQLVGFSDNLLNALGAGYVCVSADRTKAPLVIHAASDSQPPDASAPIWDFATQGSWSDFANANPTISPALRLHIFGGEDATLTGIAPRDPRFFNDPQPAN